MELFQVFWDDGKKLFLEFKKDKRENQLLLPEKIKRLNLKFEISKSIRQDIFPNQPPYLVSIKKIYYSDEYLCFSIDLNEIYGYEDLQIRILRLTVFLNSGQRIEYTFQEKFNISNIWINEDCYAGFQFIDLGVKRNQHNTITREKVYQEVKTDFNNEKRESTVIYEKKSIKSVSVDESIISMISESNKTLKNIENHLKNLNLTLQNIPVRNLSYGSPPRLPHRSSGHGIERIKAPSSPVLIQSQMSSGKLMVIREMKTIFKQNMEENEKFNVKGILKPLTEAELEEMILDDEILMKKEEESINNQIKRLKKQQEKALSLENLKKPK
ncbi:MAG: hypothetical protein ACXAEX_17390 [Promethearchaeota archaeon]|jgi:hypothetical protein